MHDVHTGRPDFDINVGDIKPTWLVGVAAVTLLALRQPLTGVKTFGDQSFTDPFTGIVKVGVAPPRILMRPNMVHVMHQCPSADGWLSSKHSAAAAPFEDIADMRRSSCQPSSAQLGTISDTRSEHTVYHVLQGEFKARAQRVGDGLEVGVSQLNAVLRF